MHALLVVMSTVLSRSRIRDETRSFLKKIEYFVLRSVNSACCDQLTHVSYTSRSDRTAHCAHLFHCSYRTARPHAARSRDHEKMGKKGKKKGKKSKKSSRKTINDTASSAPAASLTDFVGMNAGDNGAGISSSAALIAFWSYLGPARKQELLSISRDSILRAALPEVGVQSCDACSELLLATVSRLERDCREEGERERRHVTVDVARTLAGRFVPPDPPGGASADAAADEELAHKQRDQKGKSKGGLKKLDILAPESAATLAATAAVIAAEKKKLDAPTWCRVEGEPMFHAAVIGEPPWRKVAEMQATREKIEWAAADREAHDAMKLAGCAVKRAPRPFCWFCNDKVVLNFVDMLTYPRPVRRFKMFVPRAHTFGELRVLLAREVAVTPLRNLVIKGRRMRTVSNEWDPMTLEQLCEKRRVRPAMTFIISRVLGLPPSDDPDVGANFVSQLASNAVRSQVRRALPLVSGGSGSGSGGAVPKTAGGSSGGGTSATEKMAQFLSRANKVGASSSDYLTKLNLTQYVSTFDAAGWDDPRDLLGMDKDLLITEFGMKRLHAKKLRKWLDILAAFEEAERKNALEAAPKTVTKVYKASQIQALPGTPVRYYKPGDDCTGAPALLDAAADDAGALVPSSRTLPDGTIAAAKMPLKESTAAAWNFGSLLALRVLGHTGVQRDVMGTYTRSLKHSPKNLATVFELVDATMVWGSGVFLFRDFHGHWRISNAEHMLGGMAKGCIISTTVSSSPLDLAWTSGNGVDPLLTVTQISRADCDVERDAFEAEKKRVLAIENIRIQGESGNGMKVMLTASLNASHSPKNNANVFTVKETRDTHLYHAINGYWWVSNTEDMLEGAPCGWLTSATASSSPLGLVWKFCNLAELKASSPLSCSFLESEDLKVTEISAAELTASDVAEMNEAEAQEAESRPRLEDPEQIRFCLRENSEGMLGKLKNIAENPDAMAKLKKFLIDNPTLADEEEYCARDLEADDKMFEKIQGRILDPSDLGGAVLSDLVEGVREGVIDAGAFKEFMAAQRARAALDEAGVEGYVVPRVEIEEFLAKQRSRAELARSTDSAGIDRLVDKGPLTFHEARRIKETLEASGTDVPEELIALLQSGGAILEDALPQPDIATLRAAPGGEILDDLTDEEIRAMQTVTQGIIQNASKQQPPSNGGRVLSHLAAAQNVQRAREGKTDHNRNKQFVGDLLFGHSGVDPTETRLARGSPIARLSEQNGIQLLGETIERALLCAVEEGWTAERNARLREEALLSELDAEETSREAKSRRKNESKKKKKLEKERVEKQRKKAAAAKKTSAAAGGESSGGGGGGEPKKKSLEALRRESEELERRHRETLRQDERRRAKQAKADAKQATLLAKREEKERQRMVAYQRAREKKVKRELAAQQAEEAKARRREEEAQRQRLKDQQREQQRRLQQQQREQQQQLKDQQREQRQRQQQQQQRASSSADSLQALRKQQRTKHAKQRTLKSTLALALAQAEEDRMIAEDDGDHASLPALLRAEVDAKANLAEAEKKLVSLKAALEATERRIKQGAAASSAPSAPAASAAPAPFPLPSLRPPVGSAVIDSSNSSANGGSSGWSGADDFPSSSSNAPPPGMGDLFGTSPPPPVRGASIGAIGMGFGLFGPQSSGGWAAAAPAPVARSSSAPAPGAPSWLSSGGGGDVSATVCDSEATPSAEVAPSAVSAEDAARIFSFLE